MGPEKGTGRGGFTGELWRSAGPIYDRILKHPFLRGLGDGTLPEESFRYYVLQDAIYLREYARALALAAARAPHEDGIVTFCEHASGAISVERSLHEGFLDDLGVTLEEGEATEPSPTTLAYTSFLLRTAALGDYPEVLGAVLPCYWIYWEVGKALVERGSPDPRYGRWIGTYAGGEFGSLVGAVLDLTDGACEGLDAAGRSRVEGIYRTTSRYEWMFWDAAWRLEGWPVE